MDLYICLYISPLGKKNKIGSSSPKEARSKTLQEEDRQNVHVHNHYYHYQQPRSLTEDKLVDVPSYSISSSSKGLEATFRLPNQGNSSSFVPKKPHYHHYLPVRVARIVQHKMFRFFFSHDFEFFLFFSIIFSSPRPQLPQQQFLLQLNLLILK